MDSLIPSFGNLAFTLVAFVAALSIIVAIHEYGHYIVGKWSGIKADVFSIGFGPVLASKMDRHGTRWQIAAIPLGGFVKFSGDADAASAGSDAEMIHQMTPAELRATMHGAPLWARAATVAAGPIFNFILSLILFGLLLSIRGVASDPMTIERVLAQPGAEIGIEAGDVILQIDGQDVPEIEGFGAFSDQLTPRPVLDYTVERAGRIMTVPGPWLYPTVAHSITPGSAADDAGLVEGDAILAVDGVDIVDFDQLRDVVGGSDGKELTIDVWRAGETFQAIMTPQRRDLPLAEGGFETRWLIGITGGLAFEPMRMRPGVIEAVSYGADQIWFIMTSSISGLYHMATGQISTCNMSGPIGIAEVSGQAASDGWMSFFWFIAVLSTAVGLLNLFPIPVLDGGHLVFHAWEAITGHPPNDRVLHYLMAGGLTILLALMVFATTTDIFCP